MPHVWPFEMPHDWPRWRGFVRAMLFLAAHYEHGYRRTGDPEAKAMAEYHRKVAARVVAERSGFFTKGK